jgi:hypothetical protein
MPLQPGKSDTIIARNAREMMKAGHPKAQAWAAAYTNAGLYRKKKKKESK